METNNADAPGEEEVFHDALEVHGTAEDQQAGPSSVQTDQNAASGSHNMHVEDLEESTSSEEEEDQVGPSTSSPVRPDTKESDRGVGLCGCEHYRRRCKLVAPCCFEAFWCRHCHNAEKNDNEQDPKLRHEIDRKKVVEVICALCDTRQPASRTCIKCHVSFGRYTCLICKFYDDDIEKEQFHCDECGICRVGGRSNYFHCRTCNCCYAELLRDSHVCIENSMKHNCPVCFEYLFDSIKAINVMPCGHTIHNECLRGLADHSTYICPVCSKSYMSPDNMNRIWQEIDNAVANTPMPTEYAETRVDILCNDCGGRARVAFHILGHKCNSCGGYNTRRV